MRWLPLLAAVLVGVTGAQPLEAQQDAIRFEIAQVGDSTFSFTIGRNDWVERGRRGIAVDPRRRDVLVARFVILDVDEGRATALVTGQTTRVTTDHVALLERPPIRWYGQPAFWIGAFAGGVAGLLIGLVLAN